MPAPDDAHTPVYVGQLSFLSNHDDHRTDDGPSTPSARAASQARSSLIAS